MYALLCFLHISTALAFKHLGITGDQHAQGRCHAAKRMLNIGCRFPSAVSSFTLDMHYIGLADQVVVGQCTKSRCECHNKGNCVVINSTETTAEFQLTNLTHQPERLICNPTGMQFTLVNCTVASENIGITEDHPAQGKCQATERTLDIGCRFPSAVSSFTLDMHYIGLADQVVVGQCTKSRCECHNKGNCVVINSTETTAEFQLTNLTHQPERLICNPTGMQFTLVNCTVASGYQYSGTKYLPMIMIIAGVLTPVLLIAVLCKRYKWYRYLLQRYFTDDNSVSGHSSKGPEHSEDDVDVSQSPPEDKDLHKDNGETSNMSLPTSEEKMPLIIDQNLFREVNATPPEQKGLACHGEEPDFELNGRSRIQPDKQNRVTIKHSSNKDRHGIRRVGEMDDNGALVPRTLRH